MQRRNSFQTFYYRNVATGEGCGCAERVIDIHEFDRLAGTTRRRPAPLLRSLRRTLRKLGIYRRPGE